MDRLRVRFFPGSALVSIAVFTILCILALPAPAAQLGPLNTSSAPMPPAGGLTAIDVPLNDLAALQQLHIPYQDEPRDGVYRAAATGEQLVRLQQMGIAVTEIGAVAILQGEGVDPTGPRPDNPDYCYGANYTDYTIPGLTFVYDPITTSCSPATGATVTSIDIYYSVFHRYANEMDLYLGSNSPSWSTYKFQTWIGYCAPGSPPLADSELEDLNQGLYNIHTFDGRPVNQRWDFVAYDHCNDVTTRYINYWQIWVYFTTPTATPTRTPTRTVVPSWRFEGKVFNGNLGDESYPLANVGVNLYCSQNAGSQGGYVTGTTTDANGWYGLSTSLICEYYNIIQTDLAGYTSVGATSVGGSVVTANWIQYTWPVASKTLTGNKFWDIRRVTSTPTRTPAQGITNTPTRTPTQGQGPTWTPTVTPTKWQGPTWTPTVTPTQYGQPGLRVDKRLISPQPPIVVSNTIRFEIDIYNSGSNPITELFLSDTYSTTFLSYLGYATPVASDDNIDDGEIQWTDLTTYFGDIAPGRMISLTIAFHAKSPTGQVPTQNCAAASYSTPGAIVLDFDCVDVIIEAPPPQIEVDKYLLSPPVVCVSDTVAFGVTFTNTGPVQIGGVVITDTWNPNQLAILPPWGPNDGEVNMVWAFGPNLPPGASTFFTLPFHAEAPANPAINTVTLKPLSFGSAGQPKTDSAGVVIEAPGPCAGNAVVNGNFEASLASGWQALGNPLPVIVGDEKHGGAGSVRLGGGPPAAVGAASIDQWVFIPSNVAAARLTFWYKLQTKDVGNFDRFLVGILSPSLPTKSMMLPLTSTPWQPVTIDLTEFAGGMARIVFAVGQDTILPTTVWVDDVTLCFSACGPLDGGNTPDGGPFCWKQMQLPDYAPSGVPDFSQMQANWFNDKSNEWLFDAAVAAANSLWWFDSKNERGVTPPPAVSDHYQLVTAYGNWDDHDPRNVVPLVQDLAQRMATNGAQPGTLPSDVAQGLRDFISNAGLAVSYTVTYNDQPGWDWVKEEVKRSEDVILLLGFWEQQKDGWKRLGGHYVTAAGVSCFGDSIAISDPWLDNAERGGPGFATLPLPHPHPTAPPDVLHNNAQMVSHDLYGILSTNTPGGSWGLARYAQSSKDVENFFSANVPMPLVPYQATRYRNGEIVAVVERAIAVSPVPTAAVMRLDPAMMHGSEGDIFKIDIIIDAGGVGADTISANLDFDPRILVIVDAAGNPTNWVVPGSDFPQPFLNNVNNEIGHIDLLTTIPGGGKLSGRMLLATLYFKALDTTAGYGTPVSFVYTGERRTDIMYQGASVLGEAKGGFIAVAGGRTLSGSVALQGRPAAPAASWVTPLMLTIHNPGDAMAIASYALTTTNSGTFTVTHFPTGTFDVKVKGLHTLRSAMPNVVLGDGPSTINMGTLLEGDANNDNIINAIDLSIYSAASGSSAGDAAFDARADFNADGTIDSADLALLQPNFGKHGDIVAGGAGMPEVWAGVSVNIGPGISGGAVDLAFLPISTSIHIGEVFVLTVQAQAGGMPVHVAELHINLPPGIDVVAPDGTPAEIIEGGAVLPAQVMNHVDNGRGEIDYAATYLGTPPSGTFTLATMRLRAGQPVNELPVRFVRMPGRMTDVIYNEDTVLGALGASWVSVSGFSLYLPVILSGY